MFTNIGKKIKALAKVMCWIGIGVSVFIGLIICVNWNNGDGKNAAIGILFSLFIMAIGSISSYFGTFLLYGFGELIDKTTYIADNMPRRFTEEPEMFVRQVPEDIDDRQDVGYEIWLGSSPTFFARGVTHKKDGSIINLAESITKDKYNVDISLVHQEVGFNVSNEDFHLGWYATFNSMDICIWGQSIKSIRFHNASDRAISINKHIELKPGQSERLIREEKWASGQD